MLMGNERVMMIVFELVIHEIVGTMSIYIPFTMLKPISDSLNPHGWISGRKETQEVENIRARKRALEGLYSVVLPVRVFLGNARISLKEFTELRPGDILPLETSIKEDLKIQVAGQDCFTAQIGQSGNRLAAQINSISSPGQKLSFNDLLVGDKP